VSTVFQRTYRAIVNRQFAKLSRALRDAWTLRGNASEQGAFSRF